MVIVGWHEMNEEYACFGVQSTAQLVHISHTIQHIRVRRRDERTDKTTNEGVEHTDGKMDELRRVGREYPSQRSRGFFLLFSASFSLSFSGIALRRVVKTPGFSI